MTKGLSNSKKRRNKRKWIYRARQAGYFPLEYNFLLWQDDKYIQCAYCGAWIYHKYITSDHVWPKSLGGSLRAPACDECNRLKADMKPIEFALWFSETGRALAGQESAPLVFNG